jgi:hypothetical protein
MNAKNILVSFLVIASVLFLASTVSALSDIATSATVQVNNIYVADFDGTTSYSYADVGITGGDTVTIEVQFTSNESTSDVKIKAELEGEDIDMIAVSPVFDVIDGVTYVKTMTIKIPTDLKDQLSDSLTLDLRIYNSDYSTSISEIPLTLQRPSYDISIKSVMTASTVEAGQLFPVDIVLKNTGYNDLSDLYVTVKISELGIEKSAYFGDLVPLKDCDDDDCDNENTVSGRLYLEIPYNVKSGTYTLQVKAENEDAKSIVSKEIVINNAVPELAMKSGTNSLTLLNPTNQLKVYTVKYGETSVNVVIPAASSKDITIDVPTSGDYNFDVLVLSGDKLLSSVNFSGTGQSAATQLTSPVLVLTVILAVVFLVLLVVLVVLITKKPQKTEEFGESYY